MSKIKNEAGKKYGRLTVIELADYTDARRQAYWVCKCDCGNTKIARGVDLRSGGTRSCGCLKVENGHKLLQSGYHKPYDMIGEKHGRLLVLRKGGRSTTGTKWVCRCDCGNIVEVRGSSLRSGNTTSCGCVRRERASECHKKND